MMVLFITQKFHSRFLIVVIICTFFLSTIIQFNVKFKMSTVLIVHVDWETGHINRKLVTVQKLRVRLEHC